MNARKLDILRVYAAPVLMASLALLSLSGACTVSPVPPAQVPETRIVISEDSVNINTASAEEIEKIPYIGASLAQKIIDHRESYGPFSRPEELMLIQGISDKRFRRISSFVRVR